MNYFPVLIYKRGFVKGTTRGLYQGCLYYNQRGFQLYKRAFKREFRQAAKERQIRGFQPQAFPTQQNGCQEGFWK